MAITQDLTIQARIKFDNTREGLEFLLQRAKAEMVKSDCRGIMFAIETGGHYWRNIAYYLDKKGVPFRFINQYTLKRRREGKDLNKRKNDYRDSEVAAQLLCTGESVESVIPQGVYAELRMAHNAYRRLVKERTRITNLLRGLLDALFPEFVRVFKDPCGLTALGVLSACSIPRVIAGMTNDKFIAIVEVQHNGRRLMRRKLGELRSMAKTSIGIEAGAQSLSTEISFLVEKLKLIREHIETIERTLVRLVDESEEGKYLLSIMGLNYIAVAEKLYCDHDPTEFFHHGKAHYIEKEDEHYTLSFDLPYSSKDEISVVRSGDELIIHVGTYRRNIILPRTLLNLTLKGAKFENNKLVVRFDNENRQGGNEVYNLNRRSGHA